MITSRISQAAGGGSSKFQSKKDVLLSSDPSFYDLTTWNSDGVPTHINIYLGCRQVPFHSKVSNLMKHSTYAK